MNQFFFEKKRRNNTKFNKYDGELVLYFGDEQNLESIEKTKIVLSYVAMNGQQKPN